MRGVGGSTLVFSGEAHRLHPDSMKMRSRFDVAADWPLDYAELETYYSRAERLVGVAGPSDTFPRFRSEPYPLPGHRQGYASLKIKEGCRKLGLNLVQNSVAILPRSYDDRPDCNYCANCNRGCPRTDKGSVDVTFMRKAVQSGLCTVMTGCQVTNVEAGSDDRVRSVHYVDGNGKKRTAYGRVVIVACGAVETPRLLLLSKNRYAPEGIGNESGNVGRHFMETLSWMSSALHEESLGSFRGIPSDSICWDFNAPDSIPGVIGGCRFAVGTSEADLIGPINYAQRVVKGWGRRHKEEMRRSFGKVITVSGIGESIPHERSFIDLDPSEMDTFGKPVARIHTYVDEMSLQRLDFMSKTIREILVASGAKRIFEEYGSYDYFNSTHVFGTCRMGNDPQESVVNRYCRSHKWRNLFVVDASVFPSSGGGESPSLTIEALALRTAEHIHEQMKKGDL
jgi:choline dehydrogenase-like flavoprotein